MFNLYRVQYYNITGRSTEVIRQHKFEQRHGTEKTALVVAETPEIASAHVTQKHDCEVMGVSVQCGNVEIASAPVVAEPALESMQQEKD